MIYLKVCRLLFKCAAEKRILLGKIFHVFDFKRVTEPYTHEKVFNMRFSAMYFLSVSVNVAHQKFNANLSNAIVRIFFFFFFFIFSFLLSGSKQPNFPLSIVLLSYFKRVAWQHCFNIFFFFFSSFVFFTVTNLHAKRL